MERLTKAQFVTQLTRLLKETYPELTEDVITKELDSQLGGNAPAGIMGMFVADNLAKVEIVQ